VAEQLGLNRQDAAEERFSLIERTTVEAFETFVALALEEEDFIVSPAVKFPVRRQVRKASRVEFQEHGYEVDLVAARADRLVLATVKSFLGSRGVAAEAVTGETSDGRRRGMYRLLNDPEIRDGVLKAASKRYGYQQRQIEMRLYVGRFAGRRGGKHRRRIEEWARTQRVGAGPIQVVGLEEVVAKVRVAAARGQYRDNPALVAVKVLAETGQLVDLELADG
jgi:hypothetical protein